MNSNTRKELAYRARRGARNDRFPNLRRIGQSLGMDPGVLATALARASKELDEYEELLSTAKRNDTPV